MKFGILVYPDVEELDFAWPWELLGMWSKFAGGLELTKLRMSSSW